MTNRMVACFAHGVGDEWEAICLDFDIAVQGTSFEEVRQLLSIAIESYVALAAAEGPETRNRLLARRAPWHVRLKALVNFNLTMWRSGGDGGESAAGYSMPCPA